MNKHQAYHALRMDGIEDIDNEHLCRQDEDTFAYTDWTNKLQYNIVDANGEIIISKMTFKEVKDRMNQEDTELYKELDEIENLEALGYCVDCLQPVDYCLCADALDGEES